MLVEFQNFKKEDLIKYEAQLNLTDFKNPTAKMGCNSISLQIESKENSIKFSNLMSTKMFCVDKMDLETAFIKSLPEFNSYSNQGQKLILENSKAEKMVFVAQDWD
jgi:heat shock protein HslJ